VAAGELTAGRPDRGYGGAMTSGDERRAEREAAAQRWATWLRESLDRAGISAADLVSGSDGRFSRPTVARWLAAGTMPSAESAVLVARILGVGPTDALRAAGHDAVAEHIAAVSEAGLPVGDPIAELILAAGFEPRERRELLDMRAADLRRIEAEARTAEERMRAIIEQRRTGR
jgi:transcriptional regulator with XRE-family HTH domain